VGFFHIGCCFLVLLPRLQLKSHSHREYGLNCRDGYSGSLPLRRELGYVEEVAACLRHSRHVRIVDLACMDHQNEKPWGEVEEMG
jgi:hypothetical protein